MRLACSTLSFPADTLERAIAKTSWAGYRAVELALSACQLPEPDALLARVRANELEVAAVSAGEMPGDPQAGLESLARVGRAAALARSLDAPLVVVSAPPLAGLAALADGLRRLDRALADLPADVCLLNRPGTALAGPGEFNELWGLGVPARVGIALDPARALESGWDPSDLDRLPELPRHIYLNDLAAGSPVPPGEGEADLRRLGEGLALRGYAGCLSLWLEGADPWNVEPLAKELAQAASAWFDLTA